MSFSGLYISLKTGLSDIYLTVYLTVYIPVYLTDLKLFK